MGRLFGTDGVRGIVNEELTPSLALRLGLAIGTYFGEGAKILVGRDVRAGGEMISRAVISGLLSCGVEVYYCGLAPTPAIQFNVKEYGFDGGVIITASHNPAPYNGIKVIAGDGVEIPRDDERVIEEYYFTEKFKPVSWNKVRDSIRIYDKCIERYVNGILKHVDVELIRSKRFKVVIDPANSVGALASPLVAKKLGCKVLTVNGHLDSHFPWREPEPTVDTLRDTATIVKSVEADIGVGHDGDADRSIFIDERGRVMWGDRSAVILAKYLAKKYSGKDRVYTAVSSSLLVEEALRPLGIEVIWMKVGAVGISRAMMKDGRALCGFEENGGFMYPPHQYVRDGAMTLALMLQVMAETGKSLAELYDELPSYVTCKTKVPMPRTLAEEAVKAVAKRFKDERLITVDGVKVILEDGWVLVRPSGTEPVLRIMAEAKTREKLDWILREVKEAIGKVR